MRHYVVEPRRKEPDTIRETRKTKSLDICFFLMLCQIFARLGHEAFTSTLELEVLMGSDMEKTDDIQVLALRGALTIECATELKSMLLEALNEKDHLILSLEDVTEVDLSGLQILCSAHRTSLEHHKQLTIQGAQSGTFQQAVRDAGFIRSVGCHKDPHQKCLWVGGLD